MFGRLERIKYFRMCRINGLNHDIRFVPWIFGASRFVIMSLILFSFIGSVTADAPPLLWNRKDNNLDGTLLGVMRLEKRIHESAYGKVFYASTGDRSRVVKYVKDRGNRLRGEEHSTVLHILDDT